MPHHRIGLLSIIFTVMVILFLLGIFTFDSLFPSLNQTPITNISLPPSTFDSTPQNTVITVPEPAPSFTGAVIIGITRPVAILGREGFSPSDINIKVGDSITWKNADQQQKRVVLVFQRGREQNQFFNGPSLWPGEEWEHTFWEEREYNYWTTEYGVEGKVVIVPCRNRFCPHKG